MQTRSHADRFSAHGRCKTRRIVQYSHTAKYDFAVKRACTADGTKFCFKFIRRYVANFIKFMRTAINFILKFYVAEHVSTFASQNIPQMQLHYETRPTKHRAPNSLSRGLRCTNFDVRRSYCKLAATNDRNTSLPAFRRGKLFSCTRARQANTPTVSPARAVAKRLISARRDLKFRSAAANSKILKFQSPKKGKF